MEFINQPQKYQNLRSDCCSCLKGDNGEPISLKMNNKFKKRTLVIRLCLKTNRSKRHFFRLMQFGKKNRKQEREEIHLDVESDLEKVKLDFFGIQKATKEDSIKYIKDNFTGTQENDGIVKQNASIVVLQLILYENDKEVHALEYDIHVGNPSSQEIKIKHYSPKTLSDGKEITFYINNKITDENKIPNLEIEISTSKKMFKITDHPAKNVLVYNLKGIDITKGFRGRLRIDDNASEWVPFNIREKPTEILKRKSTSYLEYSPQSKISKFPTQEMLDTGAENLSSTNKKIEINDNLTRKCLRDIARVAHDFAFGKDLKDRAKKILNEIPIVSILQDDVGDTPLNNAILKGNENAAFVLLDIVYRNFPKEINQVNTSGHTALILSPACDVSEAFVRTLIKCGADLLAQDYDGDNAFNVAIQYQRTDIFQVLVEEGKDQKILYEKSPSLNKLVNDVLKQEYSEGFQILMKSFEHIGNVEVYESYIEEDNKMMYNFCLLNHLIEPLMEEDYTNTENNFPDILGLQSID